MDNMSLGKKLQLLRDSRNMTQKEFSEFLDIPQSTMSSYVNGRIAPTVAVLAGIAEKCDVSIDWLYGLTTTANSIASLGDIADFLDKILNTNEIKAVIDVHDYLPNDTETDTDKWHVSITFYGNKKEHPRNADVCKLVAEMADNFNDLESYAITKKVYDLARDEIISSYKAFPLSQKEYPDLTREEQLRRRREYIEAELASINK